MTKLPAQFIEDKALRDAAKDVITADIAHAKVNLSAKGIATRVGGRIGDGAKDVAEVARVQANDHRGIVAICIGALIVWFARSPIMEILGLSRPDEEPVEENIDALSDIAAFETGAAGADNPPADKARSGDANE